MPKRVYSRRIVLKGALTAGPMLLSSGVLGQPGRPGANSRVVTGHIGLGRRGRQLLQAAGVHAGALCDVDARQLQYAAAIAGSRAKTYADYRELLDRTDIDAVVIATPSHGHALPALRACETGKDVYLETPACKTLGEARLLEEAARIHGTLMQLGAPATLAPAIAAARDYVAAGKLGAISRVTAWGAPNPQGGERAVDAELPATLDWDGWLGPARWRPYDPAIVEGAHHFMRDFGGGQVFLQGGFVFAALLAILGEFQPEILHADSSGPEPEPGLRNCPALLRSELSLGSGCAVVWEQKVRRDGEPDCGLILHGERGELTLARCDQRATVQAEGLNTQDAPALDETALLRHWFDCIVDRKTPAADVALGCAAARLAVLADLSWQLGRPLAWDCKAGRFNDDSLADRYVPALARGEWQP